MKKLIISGFLFWFLLPNIIAQNVGIGTTTPNFPLSFPNTLGDKISLWGTSGNHYGFGVQSGLLQIHSDASFAHIGFGFGGSSNFTERMRIINEGEDGMLLDGRIVLRNGTSPLNPAAGGGVWMYKGDNSGLLGFMGVQNNQNIGFYGGPVGWGFTYDAINSRVGIGNINPLNKLDVDGDINLTGKIKINGNTGTAGQILKSNGASTSSSWENIQYKQVLFSGLSAPTGPVAIFNSVSQSIGGGSDPTPVEYIIPYSGKIESISIRSITTFSSSGLNNDVSFQLLKNGNPITISTINVTLPVNSTGTFNINVNQNFVAGDRFAYRLQSSEPTTRAILNVSMALFYN